MGGRVPPEFFEHVLDGFDQACTIFDERMAAAVSAGQNAARNRQDGPPLLHPGPRRDERPALVRSFDHHDAEAEPADDAVAKRKVMWERQRPGCELAHDRAARGDACGKASMLLRIDT